MMVDYCKNIFKTNRCSHDIKILALLLPSPPPPLPPLTYPHPRWAPQPLPNCHKILQIETIKRCGVFPIWLARRKNTARTSELVGCWGGSRLWWFQMVGGRLETNRKMKGDGWPRDEEWEVNDGDEVLMALVDVGDCVQCWVGLGYKLTLRLVFGRLKRSIIGQYLRCIDNKWKSYH